MPIFRVKSVKIYTGQKNLHWRRQWRQWQLSGMMIVHPHSSPATCRWQRCVVVFIVRRFYSKVDFPPVGISSCHQMTSEHLLFASTNTFALSHLDQACSWIVYVTSGCCRKHLKSIESICAELLSGFHHYLPKIYCTLGIFLQKHLIDAFTDLWSTLMNALNLKMITRLSLGSLW